MTSVSGEMQIGEASAYAAKVQQRLIGPPTHLLLMIGIQFACALLGAVVELLVRMASGNRSGGWIGFMIGLLVGWWLGARACRWWSVRKFRNALAKRDFPNPWIPTISASAEGLTWSDPWSEQRWLWSGVTEVIETPRYWIFVVCTNGLFVPRRFFADIAHERAFLAKALSHMAAAAQARSRGALAFAEIFPTSRSL